MRLEKIVLNGFKSFAEKTEFNFKSSVTAIVGPNGCGKSNVVDAVKWVLGEQSVKSLRSDMMADVIFSGSSSRKPQGAAEVNLFLSNPDGSPSGKLPIDASEIQITRRIYKNGESEYRINNNTCRLKDLRELFMDTGVGTKAYSIIEQGQIEQVLSGTKIDRRAVFEEAAGISKYKAHKKEAIRKLERTEQNLLRLADILNEVTKNLRSVKLQAGKARSFLQYSQRLKELQGNFWLAEYAKNQTQLTEKTNSLDEAERQLQQLDVEVAKNDALAGRLGEEKIELEHKLQATDNLLVSIQSKIEQLLQRIEFLRARLTELQQRKENAGQRIEKLQEQERIFQENLTQHKKEIADSEKMLEEKARAVEQTQKAIQQLNAECASLEADLEDNKSGIIDIVRRTAQLHNEIQSISAYRDNLSNQKSRLAGRAETANVELEKLFAEKAHCKARLDDIEKVLSELHRNLDSKRKRMEEITGLLEADNKRLAHSKEMRSALCGESAVLEDMEKRYEGLNSGVKNILQNKTVDRLDYIETLLAEIIKADLEYANAVEAALEGKTDSLVVNSTERLLADTETIEKLEGRVNFICLDKIEPFIDTKDFSKYPCVRGRLVEFVRTESKYAPLAWKLLGKTILVDSVDNAIELAGSIAGDYTFVTANGEAVSADGTVKLGPMRKPAGLISRKSRLRQLEESIAKIQSEIEMLEEEIEKKNHENAHLDKLCKDLRTAVYEANTEKMQTSSKLTVFEQDINRLKKEQPLIAGEIDQLEAQIAQSVQKEYDSQQKLQELEVVNKQRTQRIKELETKYNERKDTQQAQMSLLTDLKVAMGQAAEQSRALKQIIMNLESQVRANRSATETSQNEIKSCSEQWQQGQSDILNCEAAVSELFIEKEQNQKSNKLLYEQIEKLLEEKKQIEEVLLQKRSEKSKLEAGIGELKIEIGQLEVKRQDLIERVQEELQIDLAEAYKNYTDSQVDWDQVREEINELRGKIERLGNVNVDAIAEQEGLEQRHKFLSEQADDLNSSRAQLQQLINRLNKKSREKFVETFEQIRAHFQQIFRKLFGGGKADIVLEDSEDPLEAGIEVVAKPPGKETRSISLLSGGEKSMTAIALLFAVFKTKPSPFCFLDEIDAALDEANNERFNILLQEFQKDSQFVVITHSKRTMSIADELVGITMQTQGVSKKISVRFDQFDEQEETAAVA
jgi:chromosome segregation protein